MRTEKDVEAYLLRSNRRYRAAPGGPGAEGQGGGHDTAPSRRTFLVDTGDRTPPVAVLVDPPLVVLRVHVGDLVPAGTGAGAASPAEGALFRKLLELNARQLVHASYGIEDSHVVLSSALELENLDFNEIQATLDEMDLALAQHLPVLAETAKGAIRTTLG
jgi:hypothetical protein